MGQAIRILSVVSVLCSHLVRGQAVKPDTASRALLRFGAQEVTVNRKTATMTIHIYSQANEVLYVTPVIVDRRQPTAAEEDRAAIDFAFADSLRRDSVVSTEQAKRFGLRPWIQDYRREIPLKAADSLVLTYRLTTPAQLPPGEYSAYVYFELSHFVPIPGAAPSPLGAIGYTEDLPDELGPVKIVYRVSEAVSRPSR